MADDLKGCPFCGKEPVTYFRTYGSVRGFPAFSARIQCENCGIEMSQDVEYDTATGMTHYTFVQKGIESIIRKWNARYKGGLFSPEDVRSIIIETGHYGSKRFKLGETIKYDPDEVMEMLKSAMEVERN